MEKPAVTKFNIHPYLKNRWSPRAFSNKVVEKKKLRSILEAGRWSPSAFNEQPWRYIVGQKGSETWQLIYDTLIDFNKSWAKNANVLVLVIAKSVLSSNGKPNATYQYDTGQSVAHITFQAVAEGLFVHQMGGFSKEKAVELFDIPEEYKPLTVFALGYMGDIEVLENDSLKKSEKNPRERKPLNEIAFENKFGNQLSLL